jgi:hypothetical protein
MADKINNLDGANQQRAGMCWPLMDGPEYSARNMNLRQKPDLIITARSFQRDKYFIYGRSHPQHLSTTNSFSIEFHSKILLTATGSVGLQNIQMNRRIFSRFSVSKDLK